MKSRLRLAEIAMTFLAVAHLGACGSSTIKSGSGGSTGSGGASSGGATGSGGAAITDGGTDTVSVDVRPPVTGPCTPPTGPVVPSGTAGLQAAGTAIASTATRPQLDLTAADAKYTIAKVLATGVGVGPLGVVDNWDPVTNGIGDVTTFTPMFTVALDGSGSHTTVQAAITDARLVTATACARVYILVKPGIYRGTVVVPNRATGAPITLYGSDPDATKTVIVFNNASLTVGAAGTALGTSGSATFTQSSVGFQAKNITFSNDYVETGSGNEQAVAFLNQGDKAQFENVRVLGNQDTILLKAVNVTAIARAYLRDCYLEGDTDFIFGRGTVVFDHCEIHTVGNSKTSGTATSAPSTEITNTYGFLFISSKFTADANVTGTYFSRQWFEGGRPEAVGKMIVRNSTIGAHIIAAGPWQPWAGRTIPPPFSPDGGSGTPATTPLYTSDDYYRILGGAPVPPEVFLAEYGNTPAP